MLPYRLGEKKIMALYSIPIYMLGSIKSQFFPYGKDGKINLRGLYTNQNKIPGKGGMTIPNIRS